MAIKTGNFTLAIIRLEVESCPKDSFLFEVFGTIKDKISLDEANEIISGELTQKKKKFLDNGDWKETRVTKKQDKGNAPCY